MRHSAAVLLSFLLCARSLALLDIPLSDADKKAVSDAENDGWPLGRIMGVSKLGVVTKRLRGVAGSGALLALLADDMEASVASGRGNCAVRNTEKWVTGQGGFSAQRAWPLSDVACVSRVGETEGASEAIERSRGYVDGLEQIAEGVVRDAKTGVPFAKPGVGAHWSHTADTTGRILDGTLRYKQCTLERLTAVRYQPTGKERQWYFLASITNEDQSFDLADTLRLYITEYVGVDAKGQFIEPLTLNLRPWTGVGGGDVKAAENTSLVREKFSTAFERWAGRVSLSAVYSLPEEDSPALLLALEESDVPAGQAEDALTPSNIGILALPMALNIIPVALVADVSSIGLFIYTIMTDILTTIPFLIKGFELFSAGSKNFAAKEVWYTGENSKRDDDDPIGAGGWIVAESWSASCVLRELRGIGLIFIAVGFTMLFLGVFLEYLAQRLRSKWMANGTLFSSAYHHLPRNRLKADALEPDLRTSVGLSPNRSTNPHVMEEEQSFLDHQVVVMPPAAAAAAAATSAPGKSERKRSLRYLGKSDQS